MTMCEVCKGTGIVENLEVLNDIYPWFIKCSHCGGNGKAKFDETKHVWAGEAYGWLKKESALKVLYTNYKGEVAWRYIIPLPIPPEYTTTPHHPLPQWILRVWDLDKNAERSYALTSMHRIEAEKEVGCC